jgi:prevent-host-death family protein
MSKQVNLYEAKTNLSRLVEEAAKGNEIVIAKNGVPLARLVSATSKPKKRRLGASNHRFVELCPAKLPMQRLPKSLKTAKFGPIPDRHGRVSRLDAGSIVS